MGKLGTYLLHEIKICLLHVWNKNFNVQTKIICIVKKSSLTSLYFHTNRLFIVRLPISSKNTNNYSPNTNLVDKNISGDSILGQLLRKGMLYAEFVYLWKLIVVALFPLFWGKSYQSQFFFSRAKTTCLRQERLCFNIGFILIHIIQITLNITSNYCTYWRLLTVNMRYLVIKDTSLLFY